MGSCFQVVRVVFLVFALLAAPGAFAGECRETEVYLRGDWGQARFTVELAQTRQERNQGLMHRESMPKSAGMLFIYPRPGSRSFWMKNTLIPLDIIFMDSTGTVQTIQHMAEPLNLTPLFGGNNIQYVLEINGGMAKMLGIDEGSQARNPAFSAEDAAWPC